MLKRVVARNVLFSTVVSSIPTSFLLAIQFCVTINNKEKKVSNARLLRNFNFYNFFFYNLIKHYCRYIGGRGIGRGKRNDTKIIRIDFKAHSVKTCIMSEQNFYTRRANFSFFFFLFLCNITM